MSKVDPKGGTLAGGQFMNKGLGGPPGGLGGTQGGLPNPRGKVGRVSAEQRARDADALRTLGVATNVEKIFNAEKATSEASKTVMLNGKLKFKSHLSQKEKNTVVQVAKGTFLTRSQKVRQYINFCIFQVFQLN